jgi:hypothetical protein
MDRDFALIMRTAVTSVIWIVIAIIAGQILGSGNSMEDWGRLAALGLAFIAAAASTNVIWTAGRSAPANDLLEQAEKAKRVTSSRDRLSKALGALDEDEAAALLEDLRARMSGGDSDGEVSAVDMLRAERRQRQ